MFGSEENLNPHDVYMFAPTPVSERYPSLVQAICSYELDIQETAVLTSLVFDKDYSFFEDVANFGLVHTLERDVNYTITRLQDTEEDTYDEILEIPGQSTQTLGIALYNHLYYQYVTFIQHLPSVFNTANSRGVEYVDYNTSSAPNKLVLRLKRGVREHF